MPEFTIQGAGDLKPGEMKKFQVSGTDIMVSNVDGQFYAIANTCTHMGGSLADGILSGYVVKCPRHGAEYDVRTGECVGELKFLFVKKKTGGVKSYPVKFENGNVSINI